MSLSLKKKNVEIKRNVSSYQYKKKEEERTIKGMQNAGTLINRL
jgi:hypothetical protein